MTEETRVLHLITRFLGGGAEQTTTNTIDALAEADADYDLRLGFGAEYDEERVERIERKGVETICFSSIRHYNPFTQLLAVVAVARYLRRERIDVLHTHSTEAGVVGRIAGWLARTPVVIHEVHGDPIAADRNSVLNAGLELLERVTARVSTRILVKSDLIREAYLDRGVGRADQYELIYHGVELERFRNADPAAVGASDSDVIVLFVGRLEDGKGLFDLLDAFEGFDSDGENTPRLLIVGDGTLGRDVRNAIDERGIEAVELLGYRDDVPELMAAADAFVLPSYREGTPRVITEALASGLPVVATAIAGIPEQVDDGETGILIEPGDRDALRDALEAVIFDHDLREEMAELTRGSVETFALETAQQRYRDLYEELSPGREPG